MDLFLRMDLTGKKGVTQLTVRYVLFILCILSLSIWFSPIFRCSLVCSFQTNHHHVGHHPQPDPFDLYSNTFIFRPSQTSYFNVYSLLYSLSSLLSSLSPKNCRVDRWNENQFSVQNFHVGIPSKRRVYVVLFVKVSVCCLWLNKDCWLVKQGREE